MMLKILKDEAEAIEELCDLIEATAEKAIKDNNRFTLGISGGSIIKYLCTGLPKIKTEWSKWLLFFCDERVVPEDDADSTFGVYKKDLIPKTPLEESQFVTILQGVSAEEAALDYRKKLNLHFPDQKLPRFNMLLLGMGPDGHTCSLFPGHALLEVSDVTVASITDSPKPPPARITLTYPVINNAEWCVFASCGGGKAEMLKRVLKDKEDLPAGRVRPATGTLCWIMDKDAAKLLDLEC